MTSTDPTGAGSSTTGNSHQPWVNRVYIVDDHKFFTFALTSLVNSEADLAVCGSGQNEAGVMADLERLHPDIIVMDVQLNGGSGFALAASLRRVFRYVPILFVSSLQNAPLEVDARPLEPCSFAEKTKDPADIIRGIRQTLEKFRILQSLPPQT
jgi:DNA-binding NarL/FixJ family response regulator